MLERRDLDEAGRAYISSRLAGGKTLSRLLRKLDLSTGETWTSLPPWATNEQAREFDDDAWMWLGSYLEGNLELRKAVPSTYDATAQMVRRFLSEHEHAVAIWEDAQANATDIPFRQHPESVAFLGDEVYHFLDSQSGTDGNIGHALTSMVAWWGSPAVLATPPEDVCTALRPGLTLTSDHLQAIVDNVRLVFFEAYDSMGYVFWKPSDAGHQAST